MKVEYDLSCIYVACSVYACDVSPHLMMLFFMPISTASTCTLPSP